MKRYKILHLNRLRFTDLDDDWFNATCGEKSAIERLLANSRGYTVVALVNANDLEDAFRLTNHIDHSWTENAGVLMRPGMTEARSSSVGDVFVDVETGTAHYVDRAGFKEV